MYFNTVDTSPSTTSSTSAENRISLKTSRPGNSCKRRSLHGVSRPAPRLLAEGGDSCTETDLTESMAARYRQISGDSDRCAAWTPTAACEASKAVDLVCEEARRAALTESVFRRRARHGVARVKTYGEVFEEYEW